MSVCAENERFHLSKEILIDAIDDDEVREKMNKTDNQMLINSMNKYEAAQAKNQRK